MSKVKIEEAFYGQWGKCVRVYNEIVEVIATLDFGPRIIRYAAIGKENMFYEDKEFKITNSGEQFNVFGAHKQWKIYGGHRLWVSPESNPRTYYPDSEKVQWSNLENGILLRANEEKWTQVQKEIEINLSPSDSKVTVIHRVKNKGAWPIVFAPWGLSVMSPGGKEIIPQSIRETGLLPNRQFVLWPYSKINDTRVNWGDRYITIKQDPNIQQAFKLGINNELGWSAYFNNECLFVKKYNNVVDGNYPDFGVSYETYTNNIMLEMETLGELSETKPNETVEHIEEWYLFENVKIPSNNDYEIEEIMNPYINYIM
ncbi:hypothetical protein [Clostridium botulinum]|uniref:hypothetical protein n=1 Tax=Clostridium botulinum TaxID=1491 RepID=UPI0002E87611|nr:hypothetical protein [Clostridium botulinum]KEI03585.1 hypothetical protein Z953_03770 [Clostridium botulinum D str. 16868]KLU74961.1 hypothetical protein CBC3_10875 [Clostridium botulinum V891]KOC34259.1 hypothetical protein ADU81_06885 [Clostridium botulinum]MCD3252665.1 hypothetical protein [Clostridium botulinum C/D]MCD3278374.1 hypothetical protein [Clostridium botulinum C/D]